MTLPRRPVPAGRVLATGALAVALVASLAACSGSSSGSTAKGSHTPSASPSVTLSGPTALSSSAGIRLKLPAGWHPVPLGNRQLTVLNKLFGAAEVSQLSQQIQVGQSRGMQLFAVQPRSGSARPGTLSVALNQATSQTLDSLQKSLLIGTAQAAKTQPVFDRVRLPSGESLRVHYQLYDGDSTTQYYVLAGPLAFTLTVTTPDHNPNLAVDDAVARSMHLSNAA